MPSPKSTRRETASGTSRVVDTRQMKMVFGSAFVHQLGAVLAELPTTSSSKGRKASYPATCLMATWICARAARSQAMALEKLHDEENLWAECRAAYEARSAVGEALPLVPPREEHMRYFKDKLASSPLAITMLQARFRKMAVSQARQLGNLTRGAASNGAAPDPRLCIYGDGTVIKPFSDVQVIADPRNPDLKFHLGSRAQKFAPRVQTCLSDLSEDDKQDRRGLNMVSVHTWTEHGRVVLGTGTALRGELWATLDILDDVADLAGDGIHTLIYDRAVTGWAVDYLMAVHGIQVLGKAVASNATNKPHKRDLDDQVLREFAEFAVTKDSLPARYLRQDVQANMVRSREYFPVGMSVYPTTGGKLETIWSQHSVPPPATHTAAGGECVHELVVDDGGLFLVGPDPLEGMQVKTRFLPCQGSRRFRRADGRWAVSNIYTVPCRRGDFSYSYEWCPDGVRRHPQPKRQTDGAAPTTYPAVSDPVGWRLRPLSRCDDVAHWYNTDADRQLNEAGGPFSDRFGRRNDSESYNQWFQISLPHHGRAASLSQGAQELDFLFAAVLNNVVTWSRR